MAELGRRWSSAAAVAHVREIFSSPAETKLVALVTLPLAAALDPKENSQATLASRRRSEALPEASP